MNKMAIGFVALIVLCIFMWLMSVARRRAARATHAAHDARAARAARGVGTGAAATTDAENAVFAPVPGSEAPTNHHHHHHHDQPADGGASSAHGGHVSADVSSGHFDAGSGHSH